MNCRLSAEGVTGVTGVTGATCGVAATSGPGGEAGASSSTRHSARCSASGNAGTSSRLNMRPEHAAQVDRR